MTLIEVGSAAQIKDLLAGLKSDTSALWGNMNAHQMVEHLISEVRYTNGVKIPVDTGLPPDFAERKQRGLNLDYDFPRNIILGTLPEDYEYTNIEEAKKQFVKEVEKFHQHFAANPGLDVLHGGFGMMNYNEWVVWHGKHFTHHFKQFGLIPL